jgi:protein-S-isoprenylcysteine O-methyltransferase Ste14
MNDDGYRIALALTWSVFAAYWLWSARNVKHVARAEPWVLRFGKYWLPLLVAGALIFGPGELVGRTWLREQFVPHSPLVWSIGLALAIIGVAFAIWARVILGRNWSSVVQVKQDHELIQQGPYAVVRHPIYTGLLLAFLGSAIIAGDVRGLVGVAIVFASFWIKLRLEERWMGEQFGQAYADYRRRTKALIPGLL